MKRTILMATMLACFAFGKANAQTVNGIKLAELNAAYLEVSSYEQVFSDKIYIYLEYGQKVNNDKQAAIVKDDNGNKLEFNSVLDFLSMMKKYGYELAQAYAVSHREDRINKYYVLKRID